MITQEIRDEAAKLMRWCGQRYGQAIFNAAVRVYPNADALTGTAVDPFYNDLRVEDFLAAVELLIEQDEEEIFAAEIERMEFEDYSGDYEGYVEL